MPYSEAILGWVCVIEAKRTRRGSNKYSLEGEYTVYLIVCAWQEDYSGLHWS
jgi:hypothetical protein